MFERFTETARRVVFYSRYQAAMFGSKEIEPVHLLVAILAEAKDLARAVIGEDQRLEHFKGDIEARHTKAEEVSTRGDVPMSKESKRALAFAAEEAAGLQQGNIGPEHLLLGLLRLGTPPAETLAQYGVTLESARRHVMNRTPEAWAGRYEPFAVWRVALYRLIERRLPESRWGAAIRLLEALCEERVEISGTDSQGGFSIRYGVPGNET